MPTGITDAEIAVGMPIVGDDGNGFARKVKDWIDYLNSQLASVSGLGVPNGSFEIDADADGIPDRWTRNLYTGGSFALDTTTPAHGATAIKFTHPGGSGNGGGYLESPYLECAQTTYEEYYCGFLIKCSAAGMKNQFELRFYDKAQAYLSSYIPYNSTANPTSWTQKAYSLEGQIPSNARYVKIRLISGYTDTDVAGDVYWDNVIFSPMVSTDKIINLAITTAKIAAGAVTQSKLATTTGSATVSDNGTGPYTSLTTLPGGEYVLGITGKGSSSDGLSKYVLGSGDVDTFNGGSGTNYVWLYADKTSGGPDYVTTVTSRYVTASGTEHWYFALVDKESGHVIATWEAPDHPSYGNGNNEILLPHPFFKADYKKQDIVLLPMEDIRKLKDISIQNNQNINDIFHNHFIIDKSKKRSFEPRDIDGKKLLIQKHESYNVIGITEK